LKTLFDGGRYYEGPRWHDGKLWFVDCMTRKLLGLTLARDCIEHASFADDIPCGLGVLPDGRMPASACSRSQAGGCRFMPTCRMSRPGRLTT
jgi:sugar lactone lactonase YvrE